MNSELAQHRMVYKSMLSGRELCTSPWQKFHMLAWKVLGILKLAEGHDLSGNFIFLINNYRAPAPPFGGLFLLVLTLRRFSILMAAVVALAVVQPLQTQGNIVPFILGDEAIQFEQQQPLAGVTADELGLPWSEKMRFIH